MKAHILIRMLLGFSIGILAANSAFADRNYKHHHRHDSHQERAYYVETEYRDNNYDGSNYKDYGQVINARPIYQRVAVDVPQESCRVETIARESHRRGGDSFAGTVVGGLIGGAIGHELGHGRGGATAVGGLIGAAIGNDVSSGSRVVRYHNQEVCDTQYRTEYENRIVGYNVSYRYHGRIYQTRTNRHPGSSIPVAIDVRPSYRD